MAQTTAAMSGVNFDIEVALAGSGTWTNISGSSNMIAVPEQARQTGDDYTADGDPAIVTPGKLSPIDVTVTILFTNESAEAFETVRPWFEADGGSRIDLRWSPQGVGATGRAVFNALNVVINGFTYPGPDASAAAPLRAGFKVRVPQIIRTTTASSTGLGSA